MGIFDFLLRKNVEEDDESFSYARILTNNEIQEDNLAESQDSDLDSKFELLVQAYLRDTHYQSRKKATFSFVYAIMNACFVALPYACSEIGIPLYIFSILVFGCISGYTAAVMVAVADEQENHPRSLEELTELALGPKGFLGAAILQILLSLTLMTMSIGVFSEVSSCIMSTHLSRGYFGTDADWLYWLLTSRPGGVCIGGAITLPIILRAATVSHLRWMSYVSIICILAAFLSVVVSLALNSTNNDEAFHGTSEEVAATLTRPKAYWWVFSCICTICFSNSQKNFSVYGSLRQRNPQRWKFVVRRAYAVVMALYLCFGTLGYLSHLDSSLTRFNFFLDSKSNGNLAYDVLRGLTALCVLLLLPGDCLVASTTIRRLIRRTKVLMAGSSGCLGLVGSVQSGKESTMERGLRGGAGGYKPPSPGATSVPLPIEEETSLSSGSTSGAGADHTTTTNRRGADTTTGGGADMIASASSSSGSSGSSSSGSGSGKAGSVRPSTGASSSSTSAGTGLTDDTEWMTFSYGSQSDECGSGYASSGHTHGEVVAAANTTCTDTLSGGSSTRHPKATDEEFPGEKGVDSDEDKDEDEDEDEVRLARKQRSSSVGDVHAALARRKGASQGLVCMPADTRQAVTMLLVWCGVVALGVVTEAGVALAATIGGISTAVLGFALPSLLYHRLGLTSDYQKRPLIEAYPSAGVPNQVFMALIGLTGLALLVSNVVMVCWTLVSGPFDFDSSAPVESAMPV